MNKVILIGRLVRDPMVPLSRRACAEFLARARESRLRSPVGFLKDVKRQAQGVLNP